jgi:heme/copper-type cytochrome/quinol oxidase subunit 3
MSTSTVKLGVLLLTPVFVAIAFSGDPCDRSTSHVNAASLLCGSLTLGAAVYLVLREHVPNPRRRLLLVTVALGAALGSAFLMLMLSVMRWASQCAA